MDSNKVLSIENRLHLNGKTKLTLIIGSGLHKHAYRDQSCNNILTSWSCLLKCIDPEIELTNNYLLDFERIIFNKTKTQRKTASSGIENLILSEVSKCIKDFQSLALKELSKNYPVEIFNPKYVSDVISLNFDSIGEKLFKLNNKEFKRSNLNIEKRFTQLNSKKSKLLDNTLYCHEYVSGSESIRFWYPHGSIQRPTSLVLSARRYGMHIATVENLRQQ